MCSTRKNCFVHPRYRINRIVLSIVGLWPYQQKRKSRFCLGIIFFIGLSIFSCQVRKIMVENYTTAIMLESVPPFIIFILGATNLTNWCVNTDNVHELMKLIERDWKEYIGPERKILEEYADNGRTMVLFYTAWLYVSMVVFLILPFSPKLIIAFGIANISAEARFPFPVDFYNIDVEKYYVYLEIYVSIHTIIVITLLLSSDLMFLLFVHHSCGKSAAICYRLENLVGTEDLDINLHPDLVDDNKFHTICYCIKRHTEVIQFTEILEAVFCWAFLLQISMNVVALSLTAVQVVTRVGALDEAIQHGVLSGAEVMHLFFACYYSQKVIDHGLQISEALNTTKWYETSMRCRRLLNFMIMRSLKPAELKAGKVYTMSMENFSALMRTSMSYFTIALQTARYDDK